MWPCFNGLGTSQPHEVSLDLEDGRDQREGELGQPYMCIDGETGSERQRHGSESHSRAVER